MPESTPAAFLKYAVFCRDTEESPGGELTLSGIIDLVEVPIPTEGPAAETRKPVLMDLDLNLAFCIAGASPGLHHLLVAIKAPGIPLEMPPPERIEWPSGILFQRWIKMFRIPVQRPGLHIAAILFDGHPVGQASFMVRLKVPEGTTS